VCLWRDYGLVPIAYEDYGGSLADLGFEVNAYYAVAVARRRDTELTLFNLKRKSFQPVSICGNFKCQLHRQLK